MRNPRIFKSVAELGPYFGQVEVLSQGGRACARVRMQKSKEIEKDGNMRSHDHNLKSCKTNRLS